MTISAIIHLFTVGPLMLLVLGLIAGVALSAMGMQLITSRLYGLAPTDPVAFAVELGCGAGCD